ncbi:MAG: ADP-ribosylglycohydrolase family protein [Defluviitaleaceae bacterium]|nr:ADP-ribosylglycohydrolase family protein [Defluviitaleaceae bacterium]
MMTLAQFRSKLLGCWMGKNIGGTLGGPFEGAQTMLDVEFYTHDITGDPLPNDDLDLQLVWLYALERYGKQVDAAKLGELWLSYIPPDWVEYGAGKNNMRYNIVPPMSGYMNNPYRDSNGAWIRSEIWACVAPGHPNIAVRYAREDAIVDHSHEGLYAEVFCAAMQSAAFAESDIHKLIQIGLSYIPADSGVARAINCVIECHKSGCSWQEARMKVLTDYPGSFLHFDRSEPGFVKDVPVGPAGWDAPGNVGIVIIGLLYGEGDMGKSVCIATNCGEDTDCTAGTVGATLGIIMGIENIPEKWITPIGRNIKTMSIHATDWIFFPPQTIDEMTERVLRVTPQILGCDLCDYVTADNGYTIKMKTGDELRCPTPRPHQRDLWYWHDFNDLLRQSPFCVRHDHVIFNTVLDYGGEPYIGQDSPVTFTLRIENQVRRQQWMTVKWFLPPGFEIEEGEVSAVPLEAYHLGNLGWVARTFTLRATDKMTAPDYSFVIEVSSQGRPTKGLVPVFLIRR